MATFNIIIQRHGKSTRNLAEATWTKIKLTCLNVYGLKSKLGVALHFFSLNSEAGGLVKKKVKVDNFFLQICCNKYTVYVSFCEFLFPLSKNMI